MRRDSDRFSRTPIRFTTGGFPSTSGNSDSPHHPRTFAMFPATSPSRDRGIVLASRTGGDYFLGDPCDNSSLTSRRTSSLEESATTGSEKDAHDFVGASIYSTSLVEEHLAQNLKYKTKLKPSPTSPHQHLSSVNISLEKSIDHGLELLNAWGGPCSAVGSENAPTEVAHNRASDHTAAYELVRAPSEASTTVATNRAVDMAMERVRQMQDEDFENTLNEAREATKQRLLAESRHRHPSRYAFGDPTLQSHPSHMEAKSILSVSSNESSRITSPTPNAPPSSLLVSDPKGELLLDQMKAIPLPYSTSTGRLGDHMLKGASMQEQIRVGCDTSVQSESLSSSVGVETGGRRGINAGGISKKVWRDRHPSIEVLDEVDEEEESFDRISQESALQQTGPSDLLLPDLNDSYDSHSHSLPPTRQQHTGQLERRIFSVQAPTNGRPLMSQVLSPDDPCFSPPSIQRYVQDGSTLSPDPIFCSRRSFTDTSGRMSGSDGSGSIWFGLAAASMRSLSLKSEGERSPNVGRAKQPVVEVLEHCIHHWIPTCENRESTATAQLHTPDFQLGPNVDAFLDVPEKVECDDFDVTEVFFPNPEIGSTVPNADTTTPLVGRESAHETLKEAKTRIQTYARATGRISRRWPVPSFEQKGLKVTEAKGNTQLFATVNSSAETLPTDSQSKSQIESKFLLPSDTDNGSKTASSFLAAISTFENSGRKSTGQFSSDSEKRIETPAYGKNRIGTHISRTVYVSDVPDTDEASVSVDVQSIRTSFEPSVASPNTQADDDDDDNVSVKDLRERFEGSVEGIEVENGISRVRAMFEAKKSSGKRFEGANSMLKEVFTKFEKKSLRSVSRHARTRKEGAEMDHKPSDVIEKDQDSAAKGEPGSFVTLSVADRIRAIGGHGNTVKPSHFSRKYGIGAKNPPPPPPPPRPLLLLSDIARRMDADGRDQVLPTKEREKTNSTFRDNLKLFSGKKQEEEQAKVVASSLFRERIGQFSGQTRTERETTSAPTRCHSEPEPHQSKVISVTRTERENPAESTTQDFEVAVRESSERPDVVSITRKERKKPTGRTTRRSESDSANKIAVEHGTAAETPEHSTSYPNINPVVLRPVAVKRVLSNTVAIRPVAVRPTANTFGSQAEDSRFAGRVLQFWGDTGQEYEARDKHHAQPLNAATMNHESDVASPRDTTFPLHQTGNPPRHNKAIATPFIPAIGEHHTEEKEPATLTSIYGVDAPYENKPPVSSSIPLRPEIDQASVAGSGSEFSDGVTLDISIAEVSNLTNPTALVSKTDDKSIATVEEEEEDEGVVKETEQPKLASSKDADPIETEAKRSEASSSQLSEAAAPLIAKAMRLHPMSDDLSADSFFAGEAFLSKHWSKKSGWDLGLRGSERSSGRTKGSSGYAPSIEEVEEDEEEKKEEEELGQDDTKDSTKDGWDLRWVESSFPGKESSAGDMFDFDSGWQPFPPDPFASNAFSSKGSDANFSVSSRSESGVNVSTTSRSTTPTRKNTSRPLIRQDKSHSVTLANEVAFPSQKNSSHPLEYADELRHGVSATFPSLPSGSLAQSNQHATEVHSSALANSTTLRPPVYDDKLRTNASSNFASFHTDDWSQSVPTSYSMPSHSPFAPQSQPSSVGAGTVFGRTHPRREDTTWKRRAGIMAAKARSDYPVVSMPTSNHGRPPARPLPPPPVPLQDSGSSQNDGGNTFSRINRSIGRYGAKHAALMARLRSLKEARMRRTRASEAYNRESPIPIFPQNDQFSQQIYSPPDDEHSHSTMSSTKFGGKKFLAALELD
jgi:hypothetical protein